MTKIALLVKLGTEKKSVIVWSDMCSIGAWMLGHGYHGNLAFNHFSRKFRTANFFSTANQREKERKQPLNKWPLQAAGLVFKLLQSPTRN